jgi:galactokinase
MTPAEQTARDAFGRRFGREPAGVAFAPGRVNLIGEHVDYNDGLVLPMALREGTAVAWAPRRDGRIVVRAEDFAAEDEFEFGHEILQSDVDWRSYVRGIAACGPEHGLAAGGADLVISGTVPRGAGLSSSASLCVATGRALAAAAGTIADPLALARTAQAAEHRFAGVRCGIMDQLASAIGTPGHALLIDCRTLQSTAIAVPPEWSMLIVQSGIRRELADGEYNARRAQCEAAAQVLGVASLRDATEAMVMASPGLDPLLRRRARHVVTEIARTAAAADALRKGQLSMFGALLRDAQRSLRDNFQTSVAEIDALVTVLDQAIGIEGGARMTGGGFGGAVVAVSAQAAANRIAAAAEKHLASIGSKSAIITAW